MGDGKRIEFRWIIIRDGWHDFKIGIMSNSYCTVIGFGIFSIIFRPKKKEV